MWIQYDKRTTENIRLNKEILKNIIKNKTEKKVNWLKYKAIINVLYPIPIIIFAASDIEFRSTAVFYTALSISCLCMLITYSWAIKYYLLTERIDFLKPITTIKKDLSKLNKFKLKMTRHGLMLAPFFIASIFVVAGVNIFSKQMILMDMLILFVMATTAYITYKHGIIPQLRKINSEIDEIIKLEKD